MKRDLNGLEILDHRQCLALLRSVSVGRIGVLMEGLPVVLPVNFRLADDQVIIRTVRGTKLAAATRHAVVAFEIDESAPDAEAGWSVMVRGIARETARFEQAGVARELAVWLQDRDSRLVTISLDTVTGRRLVRDSASRLQPITAGSDG